LGKIEQMALPRVLRFSAKKLAPKKDRNGKQMPTDNQHAVGRLRAAKPALHPNGTLQRGTHFALPRPLAARLRRQKHT